MMLTVDQYAELLHTDPKTAQLAGQMAWRAQYKENDERTDAEQWMLDKATDELIKQGRQAS